MASPHPLNKPPSLPALRAPGCRLREGEKQRREQARKGSVSRKTGVGGIWEGGRGRQRISGPTAAQEQELEAARHGWRLPACGALARRSALVPARTGTSPGAGPGESLARGESRRCALPEPAAAGRPRPGPRHPPRSAPAHMRPRPSASLRLPGSSDNNFRVTPRLGFANRARTRDTVPLTRTTKPGARPDTERLSSFPVT